MLKSSLLETQLQQVAGGVQEVVGEGKLWLTNHLLNLWPSHNRKPSYDRKPTFPGSNPVSIERNHFAYLQNNSFYVAEKSDGVRYLLFCVTVQGQKLDVLMNRRLDLFVVDVQLPPGLYENTILDGELTIHRKRHRSVFLVFDAVLLAGRSVQNCTFVNRLAAADTALGQHANGKLPVLIKHFFAIDKAWDEFHNYLPVIRELFDMDGIVIVPNDLPVQSGRHDTMFKWKARADCTVDMEVVAGHESLMLAVYSRRNKCLTNIGNLPLTSTYHIGDILECKYSGGLWTPVLLRVDKQHPNDDLTYEKTLINIQENIQLADFAVFSKTNSSQ